MSKVFLIAVLPVKPRPEMQLNSISCLAGDKVLGQVFFSRGKTARNENARKRSCMLCVQFPFLYFNFALSSKYQCLTWISEICRKIIISALWRGSICHVYNHIKDIHTFLFVLHDTKTRNPEVRKNKYIIRKFQYLLIKISQLLSFSQFFWIVYRCFHFLSMTKNILMLSKFFFLLNIFYLLIKYINLHKNAENLLFSTILDMIDQRYFKLLDTSIHCFVLHHKPSLYSTGQDHTKHQHRQFLVEEKYSEAELETFKWHSFGCLLPFLFQNKGIYDKMNSAAAKWFFKKIISQLTGNYLEKFGSLNHGVMLPEKGWSKRCKVVLLKWLKNAESCKKTEDFAY